MGNLKIHPDKKRYVPSRLGHVLRTKFYTPLNLIDKLLQRQPIGDEAAQYTKINASYREYDRTFGIKSEQEMSTWYQKHPGERGAILEIAGYGVAPNDLVKRLHRKGIGSQIAYGLALAKEQEPYITTPYAECVGGDMGDFALVNGGETTKLLKERLAKNGTSDGASLIYMRPVGGYLVFNDEHGLRPGEIYDKVYVAMFEGIVKDLLAPDGTFVVEIPPFVTNRNDFALSLQSRLGEGFSVSKPHRAPFHNVGAPGTFLGRFRTLTIRKLSNPLTTG